MGFIGNLFSGNKGMGWNASGTQINSPTTTGQAQTAYDQTQQGLGQQQAFLQALQGQNGIGNQSSVFGQQQNLANLMQGVATGTGPNPALAQLNQTTGQNIAATNAALAGARGAGSNPALAARTAARLGAETQQQAVGQGATMAAQQQIAGMDALSRQQQQMASLAGTQVGQQASATNAYSTAAQQQQQNLLASINAQNQANVAMQSNINNANAQIQGITAQGQQGMLAKAAGGISGALPFIGAYGGKVPHYADGGGIQRTNLPQIDTPYSMDLGSPSVPEYHPERFGEDFDEGQKFGEKVGKALSSPSTPMADSMKKPSLGGSFGAKQQSALGPAPGLNANYQLPSPTVTAMSGFAKGGKVPALLSPGEKYLTPDQAQAVLQGKENPLNGKTIPGKAKVKGNSYDNDTVPATLEEGGCVIPRSVLQSDQPMKNAIKFVHAHMKKMAKGGKVEHKNEQVETAPTEKMQSSLPPDAVAEVLKNGHFLFSVEKPHVKPRANLSQDEAIKFLTKRGFLVEPSIGVYPNKEGVPTPENSIMVHNVSKADLPFLYQMAQDHGQESAIYSRGLNHEARYLNGPQAGFIARGKGTAIHQVEPENFYTKTKNGLIFSHDIDWDNLHKA